MSEIIGEQRLFWVLALILAGGMLAGMVYPRYRDARSLKADVASLRQARDELRAEVERLRDALAAFNAGDAAAWERAVRTRLRYHPRGTMVYVEEPALHALGAAARDAGAR
jgi:cell division protein FtsB